MVNLLMFAQDQQTYFPDLAGIKKSGSELILSRLRMRPLFGEYQYNPKTILFQWYIISPPAIFRDRGSR